MFQTTSLLRTCSVLLLLLILNQLPVQAQPMDTLANAAAETPDFLDVMDKIVVNVMVDGAMGRLDSMGSDAFQQEIQKRIFAIYTQAEIETMVKALPKDAFMTQLDRTEKFKKLIAYHQNTFLPETKAIRTKLKTSLSLEDSFRLANIRQEYKKDLAAFYDRIRNQLPGPQDPPSKRDNKKREELDITVEYHNMVPQIGSQMTDKLWYKKLLNIARKIPALSTDDQQILSDLREARFRLYFEGIGRMFTSLSVVGTPDRLELAEITELLLIGE